MSVDKLAFARRSSMSLEYGRLAFARRSSMSLECGKLAFARCSSLSLEYGRLAFAHSGGMNVGCVDAGGLLRGGLRREFGDRAQAEVAVG